MPGGICSKCTKPAKVVRGDPPLCTPCLNAAMPEVKVEVKALPESELRLRAAGSTTDLYASLQYLQEQRVPAFYVSTITANSSGFGSIVNEDMVWARTVFDVLKKHFVCRVEDVFLGLVIFAGNEMQFTPPGKSTCREHIPSPSIEVTPYADWRRNVGDQGSVKDWACVVCHEVIHYLHWRWKIIPCDEKYRNKYEEVVTGAMVDCGIPNYAQREANGVLELVDPPSPFTENAFRARLELKARGYYGDCTVFARM